MEASFDIVATFLTFDTYLGYLISFSMGLARNGTKYNRGIIHALLLPSFNDGKC